MRVEGDSYRCCTLSDQSEGEERISTSALASPHRDLQSATTVAFHNILPSVDNTPRFYPEIFGGAKYKFIFCHLIPARSCHYIISRTKTDSSSFRFPCHHELIWMGFCPDFPAIHPIRAGIGLNVGIGCTASLTHDAQETTT